MIKFIHFENFKALVDATLPLNRFTLIVGPNGSGKSTAMQGLSMASKPEAFGFNNVVTASLKEAGDITVEIRIDWDASNFGFLKPVGSFTRAGWKHEDNT